MIYSITVPFVKVFCASQHVPHFYRLFTCTTDPHAYTVLYEVHGVFIRALCVRFVLYEFKFEATMYVYVYIYIYIYI